MRPSLLGAMDRLVSSNQPTAGLVRARAESLAALMRESASVGDPAQVAARNLSVFILACLPLPLAALLAVRGSALFGAYAFVPLGVYAYPTFRFRDRVTQRREAVEKELPFFSILVSILGGAGVSLYDMFEGIAEKGVFAAMRKEALMVRRDVAIFGINPLDAFERLAASHPSKKFSNFLLGYTSKVRSGGDIGEYLGGESGALLRELEDSWTQYASRVGVVGSLMVTMFGVVPLLLLTVGFFSPSFSLTGLVGFTALGVPALTAMMVALAGRMQPMGEDPLGGDLPKAVVSGLPGAAVALLLGAVWEGVAISIFSFLLVYGLTLRGEKKEREQVDEGLSMFLKDLLEYKRQEYDLTRSLVSIASKSKYNPALDDVIGRISASLKAGVPLDEVRVDPKTRLSRLTLFALSQMAYSGGGSVDTVFQLSRYTSKVAEMKKSTRAEMKPYLILSYLTPILLVLGVAFVGGVLSNFGGHQGISLGGSSAASSPYRASLLEVADLLIVATAAALGIVGAKMTDLTVRNTLKASANVLVAASAAYAIPLFNVAGLLHGAL